MYGSAVLYHCVLWGRPGWNETALPLQWIECSAVESWFSSLSVSPIRRRRRLCRNRRVRHRNGERAGKSGQARQTLRRRAGQGSKSHPQEINFKDGCHAHFVWQVGGGACITELRSIPEVAAEYSARKFSNTENRDSRWALQELSRTSSSTETYLGRLLRRRPTSVRIVRLSALLKPSLLATKLCPNGWAKGEAFSQTRWQLLMVATQLPEMQWRLRDFALAARVELYRFLKIRNC